MGDAVNLAARLEQAAGPGEIVMGAQTWRLVHDAVTAEPLEPLRLKGKTQPVTAYRLLQIRGDVDRIETRRAQAPLVGRDSQLRVLREAFSRVVEEPSCSLFTILGMAGVGKSRLTAEFLRGSRGHGGDRPLPVLRAGNHRTGRSSQWLSSCSTPSTDAAAPPT